MCTGVCYFGGFIGDNKSKPEWLKERKKTWEKNITNINKTAGKFSQESYARGGLCDPIRVDFFYKASQII